MPELAEWWRVLNTILGVGCLVGMWWHRHLWAAMPPTVRIFLLGVGGLVLTVLVASVEGIVQDTPIAARTPLTSIALAWLAWGMARIRRFDSVKVRTDR